MNEKEKKEDICVTCEHYVETTDYCELNLFETDEKGPLNKREPTEECLFYVWDENKADPGHIYPWQHE